MTNAKFWYFRNYWWVIGLFFIGATVIPAASGFLTGTLAMFPSIFVSTTLFYFSQKQSIADRKLSIHLQERFNRRYALLQPKLLSILNSDPSPAAAEHPSDLMAYFNLCSEEYLQFRSGLIAPQIWQSWLAGMRVYYYHPSIRPLWDKELKQQSHYGFAAQLLQ